MLSRSADKFALATALLVTMIGFAAASPADLSIFPKESQTRINSFTEYQVEVTNVGPVKDRYSMSSKSTEVTIAPRDFYLDAGEKKTVNVWYNPNVDKEAGRYSFSIRAESSATGKTYSAEGIVNVIREHDVSLEIDKQSRTSCINQKSNYEVAITNEGLQKEKFALSTDYGTLSQNKVTLEDGETKTVTVSAASAKPVEKNFNIRAASTTSYAQSVKTVSFTAERCYASDVSFTPEKQDVAANTEATSKVTVRNTGTKADSFVLSASEGSLSASKLEIPAKSSRTVTLSYTPEKTGDKKITVTARSEVTSKATTTFNVYNGNDVSVSFPENGMKACETGQFTMNARIKNTGEARDVYSLSTAKGAIDVEKLALDPGEAKNVGVDFNSSRYKVGKENSFKFTAASTTFKNPRKSATGRFTVQNCYDLGLNVVPKIASAGENRSVVYEIHLENTGEKQNTYELSYEGPEWISIKPKDVTVDAGKTEIAYMYAGVPFQKKGEVKIDVTATGNHVQKTEQATLVAGKKLEDAIKSDRGGVFSSITGVFSGVSAPQNLSRVVVSLVIGAVITVFVLFRG